MKYLYIVNRDCSNIKRVPADKTETEKTKWGSEILRLKLKSGKTKTLYKRFVFETFGEAKAFANQTLQRELDKYLKAVNKRRTAQTKVIGLTELDLD